MEEHFLTFALISVQLLLFATMAMVFIMFYRVEILYMNYKKLDRGTSNKEVCNTFCYGLITWLQLKRKQLLWYLIIFALLYFELTDLYSYRPSHQFFMKDWYWYFYTIKFIHYIRYLELALMLIITIWLYGRIRFVKKRILIY